MLALQAALAAVASWYLPIAIAIPVVALVAFLAHTAMLSAHLDRTEKQGLERDLRFLRERVEEARKRTPNRPLTALVTGANSGIGFNLATILAKAGVRTILGCRSKERGTAAVERILADCRKDASSDPNADVRLVILDVSDPKSVLRSCAQMRTDPSVGLVSKAGEVPHLDFLFNNAGIMPVSRHRWEVAIEAFFRGTMGMFLETGRSHPDSRHFLAQPEDEFGACGAPVMLATHVLGHYLLSEELAKDALLPLFPAAAGSAAAAGRKVAATSATPVHHHARGRGGFARGSAAADSSSEEEKASGSSFPVYYPHSPLAPADVENMHSRGGRVVWTSSRAATAAHFDFARVAAPSSPAGKSGLQARRDIGVASPGESYGEAKYFADLLNAAVGSRGGIGGTVPTFAICPGFVDTEIAPPFFKAFLPFMKLFRCYASGFNITGEKGSHASIAAAIRPAHLLRPDRKYVMTRGELVPARDNRGFYAMPQHKQDIAFAVCQQWMQVWREFAGETSAPSGGRMSVGAAGELKSPKAAAPTPASTSKKIVAGSGKKQQKPADSDSESDAKVPAPRQRAKSGKRA